MDNAYRELPFPRTDMALKAVRYVEGIEALAIFNHSVRSYLYGRFLGEQQGLQPDRDYDDELLFLGCLLHDAGLSPEGNGDQRFDLDGADLAARFLTDQGLSSEKVDIVWDAVALHLHYEIANRKRPEIALVTAGAGYDLGPQGPHTPGQLRPPHPCRTASPARRTRALRHDRRSSTRQTAQGPTVQHAGGAGPPKDPGILPHLGTTDDPAPLLERLRRLPVEDLSTTTGRSPPRPSPHLAGVPAGTSLRAEASRVRRSRPWRGEVVLVRAQGRRPPRHVGLREVDAIAGEFGVQVKDVPWAREIELRDPDGNRLRVGTPTE